MLLSEARRSLSMLLSEARRSLSMLPVTRAAIRGRLTVSDPPLQTTRAAFRGKKESVNAACHKGKGKGKARSQEKINEGKGKERTEPLELLFYKAGQK